MARTDNDTRYPTASVGASTTLVAAVRAAATRRGLISDPFAEPLVRAVGVETLTRVAAGELDVADLGQTGQDAGFERMTDLFAVRTRFFDDFCADAGIAGIRQVVILASGLDARPYRLWWPAGTTVYEVDRPHVIEFKTQTLRGLGATPTADRRAVGVDLRRDWPAALRRIGFDADQPSGWIAEGLLIGVLPADVQDSLLDNITALSAPGSRLAADHAPDAKRTDVADYLAAHGWHTTRTTLADLFAAAGLPPPRPDDSGGAQAAIRYLSATRQ